MTAWLVKNNNDITNLEKNLSEPNTIVFNKSMHFSIYWFEGVIVNI